MSDFTTDISTEEMVERMAASSNSDVLVARQRLIELEAENERLKRNRFCSRHYQVIFFCAACFEELRADNERLRAAVAEAFSAGYEQGHDSTVEGWYAPEQALEDYVATLEQSDDLLTGNRHNRMEG